MITLLTLALAAAAPVAPPIIDPRCGTTIVLTGDMGPVWRPPVLRCPDAKRVTYDASRAVFHVTYIAGASGFNINGGSVIGPGLMGFNIARSDHFAITGVMIGGVGFGFHIAASADFKLLRNTCAGVGSDCVQMGSVQRVAAFFNSFTAPATIGAGVHPDCFQLTPTGAGVPPNSHITISWNTCKGMTQGVFVQSGDNVTVEHNTLALGMWNAVLLNNVANAVVDGNVVTQTPEAAAAGIGPRILVTGSNALACGNTGPASHGAMGLAACATPVP